MDLDMSAGRSTPPVSPLSRIDLESVAERLEDVLARIEAGALQPDCLELRTCFFDALSAPDWIDVGETEALPEVPDSLWTGMEKAMTQRWIRTDTLLEMGPMSVLHLVLGTEKATRRLLPLALDCAVGISWSHVLACMAAGNTVAVRPLLSRYMRAERHATDDALFARALTATEQLCADGRQSAAEEMLLAVLDFIAAPAPSHVRAVLAAVPLAPPSLVTRLLARCEWAQPGRPGAPATAEAAFATLLVLAVETLSVPLLHHLHQHTPPACAGAWGRDLARVLSWLPCGARPSLACQWPAEPSRPERADAPVCFTLLHALALLEAPAGAGPPGPLSAQRPPAHVLRFVAALLELGVPPDARVSGTGDARIDGQSALSLCYVSETPLHHLLVALLQCGVSMDAVRLAPVGVRVRDLHRMMLSARRCVGYRSPFALLPATPVTNERWSLPPDTPPPVAVQPVSLPPGPINRDTLLALAPDTVLLCAAGLVRRIRFGACPRPADDPALGPHDVLVPPLAENTCLHRCDTDAAFVCALRDGRLLVPDGAAGKNALCLLDARAAADAGVPPKPRRVDEVGPPLQCTPDRRYALVELPWSADAAFALLAADGSRLLVHLPSCAQAGDADADGSHAARTGRRTVPQPGWLLLDQKPQARADCVGALWVSRRRHLPSVCTYGHLRMRPETGWAHFEPAFRTATDVTDLSSAALKDAVLWGAHLAVGGAVWVVRRTGFARLASIRLLPLAHNAILRQQIAPDGVLVVHTCFGAHALHISRPGHQLYFPFDLCALLPDGLHLMAIHVGSARFRDPSASALGRMPAADSEGTADADWSTGMNAAAAAAAAPRSPAARSSMEAKLLQRAVQAARAVVQQGQPGCALDDAQDRTPRYRDEPLLFLFPLSGLHWRPDAEVHRKFAAPFRQALRTLLLCRTRFAQLPLDTPSPGPGSSAAAGLALAGVPGDVMVLLAEELSGCDWSALEV